MKINKFKIFEYIINIFIIFILIFSATSSYAANSKAELTNEQNELDKKIEETNSEIAGVKSQMSTTLTQISNYNSQISTYENEISDLENKISVLQGQITQKESDIAVQVQKYNDQQELLNKRLVAMYESGSTSYLDMLLSSDGLADFISKYYLIEQLTEYDTELLNSIEEMRIKIEGEKAELEKSKSEIESSKSTAEAKRNSLSVIVSQKNTLVSNLSEEEKNLEAELEEFEQDKKEIQSKLAAIAAQEAAQKGKNSYAVVSNPSSAGYICPLAGKTKANITTGYYGYSGHTGVDFACSSGTPILAAKSGTVVISTALRRSNGSYRSYGEYVVVSHGDGTMTLYAHMSSRAVSVGQSVSQGQTLGYVGSTGNSTGPHLHFEVRVGGRCVNPTPYLP